MSGSIFSEDSGAVDIGCGVLISFFTRNGERAGLLEEHPRPDGAGRCAGAIRFRGHAGRGEPEWDVVSAEPLTLSPSLLCRSCGHHGFIRHGKWVPA